MKKTKYISIAYLLFITVTILITYIDAKAHIHNNTSPYSNEIKVTTKTELDDFKVLVAGKGTKITIFKDTINQLKEYSINSEVAMSNFKENVDYKISGDILYIYKTTDLKLTLTTKNLIEIVAEEGSNIYINKFDSKQLNIKSINSKINGNSNKIQKLNIISNDNSFVNFYDSTIDTVSVVSNNSKTYNVRNKTKKLDVTLTNNSYIKAFEPESLSISSDRTSRYTIQGR